MGKFLGRCWGHVTFGSHGTYTTTKKKGRGKTGHAQNILPDSSPSGDVSLTSLPVKNCTTIVRKKTRGKAGHAQNILRDRASSGSDVTSGQKAPTRTDISQLLVAHAHSIRPDRACSGHVTDVTSGSSTASLHHK
jgi:hypothetical protein